MDYRKLINVLVKLLKNEIIITGVVGFLIIFVLSYYGQGKLKKIINSMIESKVEEIQQKYEAISEKLNQEISKREKQIKEIEKKNLELRKKLELLEKKKEQVEQEVRGVDFMDLVEEFRKMGYEVKLKEEICK